MQEQHSHRAELRPPHLVHSREPRHTLGHARTVRLMRGRRQGHLRLLGLALLALVAWAVPVASATAATTQPAQQADGPGGRDQPHDGVRVTAGGKGADAWYVFEPTKPRPASAPLAVITHGYYEFAGNGMNEAIARHTARSGAVVIYPRWQTDVVTPCPGPIDIEPCVRSETAGIKGALKYLQADERRVQPQLDKATYFGFSFGGILTANIANRYKQLGLPKPRALWLDDPHDGGLAGRLDEPALDDSLRGIPASTKIVCHSGAEGVISEPGQADGSCNRVFQGLGHVPARNKSLVLSSPDTHGTPALSSDHGVCAGTNKEFKVDAYDYGFCWRSWDALRSCALTAEDCDYALGDTPQNRYTGTWSDGTPMVGLKVQTSSPIRPQPTPARVKRPAKRWSTDRAPVVRRVVTVRRNGRPVALRGTASDDRALASVQVAVVRRTGKRCSLLTSGGRYVRMRDCARPTDLLTAKGARSWRVELPRRLSSGSYRLLVRATDRAGRQTQRSIPIRVR